MDTKPADREKRAYQAPEFFDLGSLVDLTRGAGGSLNDVDSEATNVVSA